MTWQELNNQMIAEQIVARGVKDENVLESLKRIPRHQFVPESSQDHAYEDKPLPIGEDQTISQPYIVALMTEALQLTKKDVVLEIGTGSGYQTALLAELVRKVYTFERFESLSINAQRVLKQLKYSNIEFFVGDVLEQVTQLNTKFDAIMVTAASPTKLENLYPLMNLQGRMILPYAEKKNWQRLLLLTKTRLGIMEAEMGQCRFVPFVSEHFKSRE